MLICSTQPITHTQAAELVGLFLPVNTVEYLTAAQP